MSPELRKQLDVINNELWDYTEAFLKLPRSDETIQYLLTYKNDPEEETTQIDRYKGMMGHAFTVTHLLVIGEIEEERELSTFFYLQWLSGRLYQGLNLMEQLSAWAQKISSSKASRSLAKRRHFETYQLRQEVVDYWNTNIDPKLSAQKAADLLITIFPLSHKKMAEYISYEKKNR